MTGALGIVASARVAASWAPDDVSGLAAWFDASAITGLSDNDAMSSWTDLAGVANMAQGTGSAQPTYQTNERNSLPIVRFGTDDYMDATVRTCSVMTLALVLKVGGSGTRVQAWNGDHNSGAGPIIYSGNRGAYVRDVALPTDSAYTNDTWERWILLCGAGYTDLYANGSRVISTSDDMITVAGGYMRLGGADNGEDATPPPEFFSGGMDLAECVLYTAALTGRGSTPTDEIAALDAYLADKWGF